jgi:hypothetical protein
LFREFDNPLPAFRARYRQERSYQLQTLKDHDGGEWNRPRLFAYQIYHVRRWAASFVLHVFRSGGVQMLEQDLSKLNRLIEDALVIAVEMDETTAIYLLSMVSLELTEKIEAASSTKPDGPGQPMQ